MKRVLYLSMLLLLVLVPTVFAVEANSYQDSLLSKSNDAVNLNAQAVATHPLGGDFIITVIALVILESAISIGAIWWYFKRKRTRSQRAINP